MIANFILTVDGQQGQGAEANKEIRLLKNDNLVLSNAYKLLARSLINYPTAIDTLYTFNNVANVFRMALIDIDVESIQKITH